ncbi:FeoB-associated Cys-rich membrane protein [Clostridium sp. DJ247]|nr:FeoB-associated Cys-rich membrane protein [Clostridium sp. DJ247]
MGVEITITAVIVLSAVYIFYKNLKKKASGKCDCGSCSSHCNDYQRHE